MESLERLVEDLRGKRTEQPSGGTIGSLELVTDSVEGLFNQ